MKRPGKDPPWFEKRSVTPAHFHVHCARCRGSLDIFYPVDIATHTKLLRQFIAMHGDEKGCAS